MKRPIVKIELYLGVLSAVLQAAGAVWEPTSGPGGCEIQALCSKGSTIFAGTWGGGIFRSADSGASWRPVNSGIADRYINALAVSENNLFAGTNGSGVFLSTDNGATWKAVNSGLPSPAYFYCNGIVFAETYTGVFFSTSNGKQWVPLDTEHLSFSVSSLLVSDTTLIAGTEYHGVWKFSLHSLPGVLWAKRDSLFTYKIPVSGDSLNYMYVLSTAPAGMTVSKGGTIRWIPKTDSAYIESAEYVVFDDQGGKDTTVLNFFVNMWSNATVTQLRVEPLVGSQISVRVEGGSGKVSIALPSHTQPLDVLFYDLSGRVIDKITGVRSRSVVWNPVRKSTGCAVVAIKNGREKYFQKIMLTGR